MLPLLPRDFLHFSGDDDGCGLLPVAVAQEERFERIVDPEEEVFLLYTLRPPPSGRYGLGYLESGTSDLLRLSVSLNPSSLTTEEGVRVEALDHDEGDSYQALPSKKFIAKARTSKGKKTRSEAQSTSTDRASVRILLRQDSTSLRTTAGDTGSVAWRSSLLLATHLLRGLSSSLPNDSLLIPRSLFAASSASHRPAVILELGAGTAVLPSLLFCHPVFMLPHNAPSLCWLSTDQENLVPLLRRNIRRNLGHLQLDSNDAGTSSPRTGVSVGASELDWHDATTLLSQSDQRRHAWKRGLWASCPGILPNQSHMDASHQDDSPHPDLILGVDCLFNPSLFPALRDALDLLTCPVGGPCAAALTQTAVLLVSELRSEEIVRAWLGEWLDIKARDRREGGHFEWHVYSLPPERMGGMELGNVAWVGWRVWMKDEDRGGEQSRE